jgi:hypothetical protein
MMIMTEKNFATEVAISIGAKLVEKALDSGTTYVIEKIKGKKDVGQEFVKQTGETLRTVSNDSREVKKSELGYQKEEYAATLEFAAKLAESDPDKATKLVKDITDKREETKVEKSKQTSKRIISGLAIVGGTVIGWRALDPRVIKQQKKKRR